MRTLWPITRKSITKAVYKAIGRKIIARQKSQLEPYTEQLKALFQKQLPYVNQAIKIIDKETVSFKAVCLPDVSEKNGYEMQALRCMPGKAMEDDKQRQANRNFTTKSCSRSWMRPNKASAPFCRRCGALRDGCIFRDGLVLRALLLTSASGANATMS